MINLESLSRDCNVEESNSDNVVGEYEDTVENEIGIKDCATMNYGVFEEDNDIVPEVGMKFRSVDEIYEIYKKYAYRVGFPIRRRSSRKGKNGVIRNVAFTCGREGNRSRGATTSLKPSATSQTRCKARLNATSDAFGVWRVTTVELKHNHEISPSKSRMYRCNRQLTENVKIKLELNDIAGIPLHKSYNSIVVEAGGYENTTFIEKDCRNFIDKVRRLRLGKGDATAIHAYFAKKTNQSPGFYFSIDYDEDGRLKNVFWADNRCRLAYKEFGDAVTFDTTYLTNKYDMPFAPFVGVNHHGQSTLLGCGLIGGEDTDTFVWLFKTWLDCMDNQPPKGIITDQDRAMQNAIEIVFPNTRHRWCLWHILRKLPEKFGYHKEKYSIFKDIHNSTYESLNPEEFVQSWVAMVDKYTLHENDWLSGLFKERSRWVPCFVNTSFWAGMSSTQRSESMNDFFDGYVHSKTSLKQFVEQYERALRSKVEKEFQADFRSFSQMIPCVSAYDIEKQFQASYTMYKFREFQEEITRLMYCKVIHGLEEPKGTKFKVCEDVEFKGKIIKQRIVVVQFEIEQCEIVCSCHSFEFRGILCRHAVLVLLCKDVRSVPQKYILRRWKRDANRLYAWVKVNYDGWITTPGHEKYDELHREFLGLAGLAADDEARFQEVKNWISVKKAEFTLRTISGHESEDLVQPHNPVRSASVGEPKTSFSTQALDPKCTKRKGAPRTVRKKRPLETRTRKTKDSVIRVPLGMSVIWIILSWMLSFGGVSNGLSANASSRPKIVNVGAMLTLNSTIGKVAKIAIEEAVKDVNANSSVLSGTTLIVDLKDTNCSGFLGLIEALRFMETDTVAVIGPQSSVVAHTILHVANELQTPFLSFAATDPTLSSVQFPYFMRTTISDLHQMTAVAEIVYHYGWKEVTVIFLDDDYGRNGLAALDDALAARRCRVSYKAGIPPVDISQSEVMDILVKVALMESRVIVIHANRAAGLLVFDVARHLGMMEDGYVWIATDWLALELDSDSQLNSMIDTLQGVLVLRQYTSDSEKKRSFLARWNKLARGQLGLSTYALYAYDTVWLLAHAIDTFFYQGGVISFSNNSRLQSLARSELHPEALSIFNGGPLLMKNIFQSDFVGLTGLIKFSSDKSLVSPAYEIINIVGTVLHRIGYWSNYYGLSTVAPKSLYLQPPNRSSENQQLRPVFWPGESVKIPRGWVFPMNGKQLRIGVPVRVSYHEFVSQVPDTNTFSGFCIDVFMAAVNLLPYAFPYHFIPYGNGRENPNYDQLVNLITTGFFDGAVGDISTLTNRTKFVDFTQPYTSSGLVVVAPVRKSNTDAWAFLRPFSRKTWGVIAASFSFIGMVVWILEHRTNDEFRGSPKQQLMTILWFSLSTLFFAHRENTVSTLGRVVLLIWLFVVLIINSSYTASLSSIRTVQIHSSIKGIESLKEGNEPIGYQTGSFAEHYLSDVFGIPKSRLKALRTPQEYATALQQGPENGGVSAVVDERPYIELFLSSHCKFRIIGEEFFKSCWGFAFPRNSRLSVDLSTAILTLSENGELQRIHDKWLTKSSCGSVVTELESERLHLSSFLGLYLLCGAVCFLALLIYFIQIINKHRHAAPTGYASDRPGSMRPGHLRAILSIIDDKYVPSERESKQRKLEDSSLSETTRGIDL